MTEQFALPYLTTRQRQLAASGYDLSYVHLNLDRGERVERHGQGQMWLLVEADPGIRVKSDTGEYYPKSGTLQDNTHEHSGSLTIQNNGLTRQQVRFIVATWVYPAR